MEIDIALSEIESNYDFTFKEKTAHCHQIH
jgi:hypothetical protein